MCDLRLIKIDKDIVEYPNMKEKDVRSLLKETDYKEMFEGASGIVFRVLCALALLASVIIPALICNELEDIVMWCFISLCVTLIAFSLGKDILIVVDMKRAKRKGKIYDAYTYPYPDIVGICADLGKVEDFQDTLQELDSEGVSYELYLEYVNDQLAVMYEEDGDKCIAFCDSELFVSDEDKEGNIIKVYTYDIREHIHKMLSQK